MAAAISPIQTTNEQSFFEIQDDLNHDKPEQNDGREPINFARQFIKAVGLLATPVFIFFGCQFVIHLDSFLFALCSSGDCPSVGAGGQLTCSPIHKAEVYHPNPLQSTSGDVVYMMQIQYRILSKPQLLDNRRITFTGCDTATMREIVCQTHGYDDALALLEKMQGWSEVLIEGDFVEGGQGIVFRVDRIMPKAQQTAHN